MIAAPQPFTSNDRLRAGRAQVLIKVMATGVNPIDYKIGFGAFQSGGYMPNHYPCSDMAGEVVEVGADVTDVSVGMHVMGNGGDGPAEFVVRHRCL